MEFLRKGKETTPLREGSRCLAANKREYATGRRRSSTRARGGKGLGDHNLIFKRTSASERKRNKHHEEEKKKRKEEESIHKMYQSEKRPENEPLFLLKGRKKEKEALHLLPLLGKR